MKTMKKLVAFALVFVTLLLCFCSCSKKGARFGADELGRTMNEKTGEVYLIAPDCYAPMGVEEEIYGSSDSNVYHPIMGADPTKWLYGEMGMLLYAEGVSLPTLDQMAVSRILVLDSEGGAIGEITDPSSISEAVSCYTKGTNDPYSGLISPLGLYTLRFEDASLGICYMVNYLEYQGKTETERVAYLYCRAERRFVPVNDALKAAVEAVIGAVS